MAMDAMPMTNGYDLEFLNVSNYNFLIVPYVYLYYILSSYPYSRICFRSIYRLIHANINYKKNPPYGIYQHNPSISINSRRK